MPFVDISDFFDPEVLAATTSHASDREAPQKKAATRYFGSSTLVHGKMGSGKSSLAFQFALNVVRGKSRSYRFPTHLPSNEEEERRQEELEEEGYRGHAVIICHKSSLNSKPPKPQTPFQALEERDLTSVKYLYASSLMEARQQLASLLLPASPVTQQTTKPVLPQEAHPDAETALLPSSEVQQRMSEGGLDNTEEGNNSPPPIGVVIVEDDGFFELQAGAVGGRYGAAGIGATSVGGAGDGYDPPPAWTLQSDIKASFVKTVALLERTVAVLSSRQGGINVPALWVSNTAGTLQLVPSSSGGGGELANSMMAQLSMPIEPPFTNFPVSVCTFDLPSSASHISSSNDNFTGSSSGLFQVQFAQLPTAAPLGIDRDVTNADAPALPYYNNCRMLMAGATTSGVGGSGEGGVGGEGHCLRQQLLLTALAEKKKKNTKKLDAISKTSKAKRDLLLHPDGDTTTTNNNGGGLDDLGGGESTHSILSARFALGDRTTTLMSQLHREEEEEAEGERQQQHQNTVDDVYPAPGGPSRPAVGHQQQYQRHGAGAAAGFQQFEQQQPYQQQQNQQDSIDDEYF